MSGRILPMRPAGFASNSSICQRGEGYIRAGDVDGGRSLSEKSNPLKYKKVENVRPPQPGNPVELDQDHRIIVVHDSRDDRQLYMLEVRRSPVEWVLASNTRYADFEDAVIAAHTLRSRERSERPEMFGGSPDLSWPGPQPWTTFREAREVHEGLPQLSARIRRGRKRVGWR